MGPDSPDDSPIEVNSNLIDHVVHVLIFTSRAPLLPLINLLAGVSDLSGAEVGK